MSLLARHRFPTIEEKNTKRHQQAGRLIIVFCNFKKTIKDDDEPRSQLVIVFYKWRKKTKRRWQARRLVVVSCNPRKTNIKVFFLGCRGRQRAERLIILFWVFLFFSWIAKDNNEWGGSSLFSTMQGKKKNKNRAHSLLSSTLVL